MSLGDHQPINFTLNQMETDETDSVHGICSKWRYDTVNEETFLRFVGIFTGQMWYKTVNISKTSRLYRDLFLDITEADWASTGIKVANPARGQLL